MDVWLVGTGNCEVNGFGPGREQPVVVQPGLSAGGYVAVRAGQANLQPGDRVVVGR